MCGHHVLVSPEHDAYRQGNNIWGHLGTAEEHYLVPTCYAINFTMVVVTYSARTGDVTSVSTDTIQGAFASPYGSYPYGVGYFHVAMPQAAYACVSFESSWPRASIFGGAQLDMAPDNGCPLKLNVAWPWTFPFNVMAPGDDFVGDKSGFE